MNESIPEKEQEVFDRLPIPMHNEWERKQPRSIEADTAVFVGGYASPDKSILIWRGEKKVFEITDRYLVVDESGFDKSAARYTGTGWIFDGEPTYYLGLELPILIEVVDHEREIVTEQYRTTWKQAPEYAWGLLPYHVQIGRTAARDFTGNVVSDL